MKIGILGTGFGAYHVSIYNELDGINIVKIFGRNKEKLNKKCIKHFIDCCKTGKENVIGINHAIKSLNLALQIKKLIYKLQ